MFKKGSGRDTAGNLLETKGMLLDDAYSVSAGYIMSVTRKQQS